MQNGKCYFQAKNPIKIDILVITYLQDDYTYNVSYKYVLNMHDTEQNFPYKEKKKGKKLLNQIQDVNVSRLRAIYFSVRKA